MPFLDYVDWDDPQCDDESVNIPSPSTYKKCYLPNRAFAVELETSRKMICPKDWKWKTDGSISGLEYLSGPVLGKDAVNLIKKGCQFLSSPKEYIDYSCGYHIHLNARDLSERQVATFMRFCYLYQGDILGFVSSNRHRNSYTAILSDDFKDVTDVNHLINEYDRYLMVNCEPYYETGSIEIRIHQGTTDHEKVLRWAELWLRLLEFGVKETNWEGKSVPFWKVCRLAKIRRSTIQYYKTVSKELHGLESDEHFVVSNSRIRKEKHASRVYA